MLLNQAAANSMIMVILYVAIFGAIIYFISVRPQRKQQKAA